MKSFNIIKRAVRRRLLRTLQPCQQMVTLMSESMDRQLKLSELVRLRLHLVVCAWCSRYLKQIKILRAVMHSPAQQIAYSATALSFEARQRIAAALNRKFPN